MAADKAIRTLLVDDHKSFLWGLKKLIESESPRMEVVGTACNQADAFALAREKRPDVILLDIDLGEGTNSLDFLPDLLREVKTRVLILTGVRERDVHDTAVERGAKGVILKDEAAEVILKAVEKVHAGEYWLDRAATGRFLARSQGAVHDGVAEENDQFDELTPAELRVIEEVVRQASSTSKQIAESLNMSVKTLNNHLTSIYSKLGVKSRLELFIYALKRGLARLS